MQGSACRITFAGRRAYSTRRSCKRNSVPACHVCYPFEPSVKTIGCKPGEDLQVFFAQVKVRLCLKGKWQGPTTGREWCALCSGDSRQQHQPATATEAPTPSSSVAQSMEQRTLQQPAAATATRDRLSFLLQHAVQQLSQQRTAVMQAVQSRAQRALPGPELRSQWVPVRGGTALPSYEIEPDLQF